MANPSKLTKKEKRQILKALGLMSQIGFTAITCVFIGVFIGRFLDGRFDTSPWFLLIFALLGCAAAFKSMIDLSKKF